MYNNYDPMLQKPNKKRNLLKYFAIGFVGAIIGGMIVGVIAINFFNTNMQSYVDQNKTMFNNENASQVVFPEDDPPTTIEAVAELITPAVVGIQTIEITEDVFRRQYEREGVGTGFIVSEDGIILTNHHVITSNPKSINVTLKDGREFIANKIWSSELLDLAVIKIDAIDLPTVKLGNSDIISVGQTAIAIGNPLGLTFQRTVTAGIISALNRSILVTNTQIAEDLIQTDASINPGNSGGPLLNSKGEVVGINTYKANSGEGMGFAIPINLAKPIINQIIQYGEFKQTIMGISCLDKEIVRYLSNEDITIDSGILIMNVEPNSGADKAGLKADDVITHVEGLEVNSMLKLREILYSNLPGETVEVKYIRDGNEYTTSVELQLIQSEQ